MAYKNTYLVAFCGIFLWSSLFTPLLVGASRAELSAQAEVIQSKTPEEVLADPELVNRLTEFEKEEIKGYSEIYYIGSECSKKATIIPPSKLEGVTEGDDRAIAFNCREKEVNSPWKQGGHIAYRYEIVRKIGKGAYGEVIEAIDYKTGEHVAIKIQDNSLFRISRQDIERSVI